VISGADTTMEQEKAPVVAPADRSRAAAVVC
jgi:hypothetical protein